MAARIVASALFVGLAALSACATTNRSTEGTTTTTSGTVHHRCFAVDVACEEHFDCCSGRCDNGVCARAEP